MNIRSACIIAAALLTSMCGKSGGTDGSSGTATASAPASQVPAENYHTSENPGKWKEREPEHRIQVSESRVFTEGKKKIRELSVFVSLQGDPQHYLEAGVIMDSALQKEFAKVTFKPGTPQYVFKLQLPADEPNAAYVIVKCNQHDMWLKRVEPLPRDKP
ncbi:hypothetical protein [Turneriella parva]|uniref:Desulfoferrodoxin ferrous iron-binding domain-containing protein n=1 Tax=Turneriella parva (strain ATCC BAA-1111 / DSM 21527 / NCTC 11395 / H) TaxID=869212 RepID=I4BBR6_TURPD|nr:hypothetical protein [Turneriella parva]AFM14723.1 hypothetical protein Turpa_4090 [Turneriella parva DSM 21527]